MTNHQKCFLCEYNDATEEHDFTHLNMSVKLCRDCFIQAKQEKII